MLSRVCLQALGADILGIRCGVASIRIFSALATFASLTTLARTIVATVATVFAWCSRFGVVVALGFVRAFRADRFAAFIAITTTSASAATATIAISLAAFGTIAVFAGTVSAFAHIFGWLSLDFGRRFAAKQAFQPSEETAAAFWLHGRLSRFRLAGLDSFWFWRSSRCWRVWQNTLDHRRLTIRRFLRTACYRGWIFNFFGHGVAGFNVIQTWVVVLQTLQLVVGRFQGFIGDQQHIDALFQFNLGNFRTLLVQQERSNFHRHLGMHCGSVVLHGLFLDDSQNLQSRALGIAHVAGTTATRAGNGGAFSKRRL